MTTQTTEMYKEAELAHAIHYTCSAVRRAAKALDITPIRISIETYYTEEEMQQIRNWLKRNSR